MGIAIESNWVDIFYSSSHPCFHMYLNIFLSDTSSSTEQLLGHVMCHTYQVDNLCSPFLMLHLANLHIYQQGTYLYTYMI